jgi:hypothetical protein
VSIKATRDVEKSCSTSDMSSSEVELDSSNGSVLKMRSPLVVAASSQPEYCNRHPCQNETGCFTHPRLAGCGPG